MNNLKIAIVAPCHIQPSAEWVASLKSISEGKKNVRIIIVDDSNGKVQLPAQWDVFGYDRQREALGDEKYAVFEKFHKSSSCKNFGHWLAWKEGADVIIGLDSDCIVPPNFIADHIFNLMETSYGWTNPIKNSGWFPRGYPFQERARKTVLSLGLWNNELDLYGTDRVVNPERQTKEPMHTSPSEVADGILPLSGMNWAVWAEAIPGFFFLPNFDYQHRPDVLYRFRRHDDIWGGYIFQRLMGARNERIRYGNPVVFHDTVVDPKADEAEEVGMIAFENDFYKQVDSIVAKVEWGMYDDMFAEFASIAEVQWKDTEFAPLIEPMKFWASLFTGAEIPVEPEEKEQDEALLDGGVEQ